MEKIALQERGLWYQLAITSSARIWMYFPQDDETLLRIADRNLSAPDPSFW